MEQKRHQYWKKCLYQVIILILYEAERWDRIQAQPVFSQLITRWSTTSRCFLCYTQYQFLSSRRQTLPVFSSTPSLCLVHKFDPIISRCFLSHCYYKCPHSTLTTLRWMDGLRKVMKHRNGGRKCQRMWLKWLLVVFLNTNHLVNSFSFEADDVDPEAEWDTMESLTLNAKDYDSDLVMPKTKRLFNTNPPLKLPASVRIPADKLYKEHFAPEMGSKPIPPLVKSILLPTAPTAISGTPVSGAPKVVEVLCYLDRMYVRVLKRFCTSPGARTHLKLGTCAVNKATATHYYLLYPLKGCGIKREVGDHMATYTL